MRCSFFLTSAALVILIAGLLPFSATAAECDDHRLSWSKAPKAGTIKADQGPRLHFQRVEAGCPGGDTCKAKAYLVPGDKVVLDDTGEAWICAYFQGPKRGTFGWLPRTALDIDNTAPNPKKQDWVGRWRVGYNTFLIDERKGRTLYFWGSAVEPTGLSMPDIDFDATPENNKVVFKIPYDGCDMTLRWVNGLLLVASTYQCGSLAANFSGVYHRTALTTDPKDEH
ncbi:MULTISPECIES: hypothetical protein [unclassified Azospirillum]|uniref:hypothetical protein n=1 Tax=unclassified Azospirillum TaxID=2630922 RepID=UPI000B75250A|nr:MULTISPECIES: hypothetical protein [unclassified Azospirillum]SNS57178.1 hypothetical protein SAMN05880556_107118 [Azospirillum sp. RU38E]SNS76926.1 hypothetical protein SAMN05880591_107118 [Azospirillum sp. RU37A]